MMSQTRQRIFPKIKLSHNTKSGNSVLDGKLTDEQIGKLDRRKNELIRRINEKTLEWDETNTLLQTIIEGKRN